MTWTCGRALVSPAACAMIGNNTAIEPSTIARFLTRASVSQAAHGGHWFFASVRAAYLGGDVSGPASLDAVILTPQGPITVSTALDVSKAAYAINAGVCEVPLAQKSV